MLKNEKNTFKEIALETIKLFFDKITEEFEKSKHVDYKKIIKQYLYDFLLIAEFDYKLKGQALENIKTFFCFVSSLVEKELDSWQIHI